LHLLILVPVFCADEGTRPAARRTLNLQGNEVAMD
jgi:hypothetical protein